MKLIRRTLVGIVAMTVLAACGDDDKVKRPTGGGGEGGEGGATTSSGGSAGNGGGSAGGSGGGTTVGENPCPPPETSFGDLETAKLFETATVPTFDFYLPDATWEYLQAHAQDEEYVEAQACYDGKAVGKVGLRFKGSYGSLYNCFDSSGKNTCRKLGMKVKFDEFDKEVKFYGIKRLNFQGYRYDNSYLKERLAYDLYRQMDIVAPRASWAVLRVNGEEQGLFGMVEQIDGRFTASRWPTNGEGNLYKEVWPGQTDETWISEHLETNEKENDIAALKSFSTALNGAAESELRATLGSYFDLAYFARYMAVDDAIGNFDGVTTFYTGGTADEAGNHNFYLYQESPQRFTLVPWDLESTMSLVSQFGNVPEWQRKPADCSVIYSVWNGQGQVMAPGCNRVFQALAADLTEYRAAAQRLLDGPLTVERVSQQIDTLAAYIRTAAHADQHGPGATEFDKSVGFLKTELPNLRRRLMHLQSGEPTIPLELDPATVGDFEGLNDYSLYAGTSLLSNTNTVSGVEFNTTAPIAGTKSVRILFDFGNETKGWEQWMFYMMPVAPKGKDISALTGIRFKVRSNIARDLRVDLDSPYNSKAYEGIKKGWLVPITTTTETVSVLLADATVPDWATDPKDDLQKVLKTVAGLTFMPQCVGRNGSGQLPNGVKDNGWVEVDDIEFY